MAYLLVREVVHVMAKTKVNIQKLKNFAFTRLPKPFALREILLSEEDELEVSIFLARLPLYLKLSRFRVREDTK